MTCVFDKERTFRALMTFLFVNEWTFRAIMFFLCKCIMNGVFVQSWFLFCFGQWMAVSRNHDFRVFCQRINVSCNRDVLFFLLGQWMDCSCNRDLFVLVNEWTCRAIMTFLFFWSMNELFVQSWPFFCFCQWKNLSCNHYYFVFCQIMNF